MDQHQAEPVQQRHGGQDHRVGVRRHAGPRRARRYQPASQPAGRVHAGSDGGGSRRAEVHDRVRATRSRPAITIMRSSTSAGAGARTPRAPGLGWRRASRRRWGVVVASSVGPVVARCRLGGRVAAWSRRRRCWLSARRRRPARRRGSRPRSTPRSPFDVVRGQGLDRLRRGPRTPRQRPPDDLRGPCPGRSDPTDRSRPRRSTALVHGVPAARRARRRAPRHAGRGRGGPTVARRRLRGVAQLLFFGLVPPRRLVLGIEEAPVGFGSPVRWLAARGPGTVGLRGGTDQDPGEVGHLTVVGISGSTPVGFRPVVPPRPGPR